MYRYFFHLHPANVCPVVDDSSLALHDRTPVAWIGRRALRFSVSHRLVVESRERVAGAIRTWPTMPADLARLFPEKPLCTQSRDG